MLTSNINNELKENAFKYAQTAKKFKQDKIEYTSLKAIIFQEKKNFAEKFFILLFRKKC